MAGVKETPRQKMIGMMYLVYTAMLALNVSAEILGAFKITNATAVETNSNFEKKINDTYAAFEQQMALDSASTVQYYNKAKEVQTISNEMVEYITDVRNRLILTSCGNDKAYYNSSTKQVDMEKLRNVSLDELSKIDDMSKCVNFFVKDQNEAGKLKDKINTYKSELVKLVDAKDLESIKLGLDTDKTYYSSAEKKELDWASYYFGSSVLAADVVILNGFIQEVRNMEFDVLSKLRSNIGATDFKFNTVEARVIPKKTNVFRGEEYEAEILVIAYDSTESPNVFYRMGAKAWNDEMETGANEVQIHESGKSILRLGTGGYSFGSQSYAGVIKIKNPAGDVKNYPFSSEFYIQEAAANISADELNVFYRGLQNPITISVPGISSDLVSANIKGPAKMTKKSSGRYVVEPTGMGEVVIDAIVTENGKSRTMSSKTFRVKPLPAPSAYIAGKQDGDNVSKNLISKNGRIEVKMPEDFLFGNITYTVKSFDVSYQKKGGYSDVKTVQGSTIPSDIINAIESMPTNSVLTIMNIKAMGPAGEQRASSLNIKVY